MIFWSSKSNNYDDFENMVFWRILKSSETEKTLDIKDIDSDSQVFELPPGVNEIKDKTNRLPFLNRLLFMIFD